MPDTVANVQSVGLISAFHRNRVHVRHSALQWCCGASWLRDQRLARSTRGHLAVEVGALMLIGSGVVGGSLPELHGQVGRDQMHLPGRFAA